MLQLISRYILGLCVSGLFCIQILLRPEISAASSTIRIGFFPNVTHAHALILQNFARKGSEEFSILGVNMSWKIFNAGPSSMEALFAGALDISYVGPVPVLNAYMRAKGRGGA